MNRSELEIRLDKISSALSSFNKETPEQVKQSIFDELNSLLKVFPNDCDILMYLFFYYEYVEDFDKAREIRGRILGIDPTRSSDFIDDISLEMFDKSHCNLNTPKKQANNGVVMFLDKLSVKNILILKVIILLVIIFFIVFQ